MPANVFEKRLSKEGAALATGFAAAILRAMRHGGQKEVEVKLAVTDSAAIRRSLRKAGARRVRRVFERNVLFDTPDRRLRDAGKLLRLRWNDDRAVLTLKAPVREPGAQSGKRRPRYKVRREVEMPIAQPERLTTVLRGLGFVPGFRYEKVRTTYRVPGEKNLKVEFDQTPIGEFLELEGPRRAIDLVARKLGFTKNDYISANYLALYLGYCRTKRHRPGHMLFRNHKTIG